MTKYTIKIMKSKPAVKVFLAIAIGNHTLPKIREITGLDNASLQQYLLQLTETKESLLKRINLHSQGYGFTGKTSLKTLPEPLKKEVINQSGNSTKIKYVYVINEKNFVKRFPLHNSNHLSKFVPLFFEKIKNLPMLKLKNKKINLLDYYNNIENIQEDFAGYLFIAFQKDLLKLSKKELTNLFGIDEEELMSLLSYFSVSLKNRFSLQIYLSNPK